MAVTFVSLSHWLNILLPDRILLAGIRNHGGCPCPRCMMPLSKTHLVGTIQDRNNRAKLVRVDDKQLRFMISQARDVIYNKNFAVNHAAIEWLLKPKSYVPSLVSHLPIHLSNCQVAIYFRMPSLIGYPSLASISSQPLWLICCMRLSSECGRLSSYTFFKFWHLPIRIPFTNLTAGEFITLTCLSHVSDSTIAFDWCRLLEETPSDASQPTLRNSRGWRRETMKIFYRYFI